MAESALQKAVAAALGNGEGEQAAPTVKTVNAGALKSASKSGMHS